MRFGLKSHEGIPLPTPIPTDLVTIGIGSLVVGRLNVHANTEAVRTITTGCRPLPVRSSASSTTEVLTIPPPFQRNLAGVITTKRQEFSA